MIDGYLDRVERWIAGPESRKQQIRAEIEAHLREAERAGDVEGAIARLGDPREAARAFSEGYSLAPAPLSRRIPAALIDIAVTVGLVFAASGLGAWTATVNPSVTVNGNDADFWAMGAGVVMLLLGAFAWWVFVLPILEWRTGRTLGKALMGLRTVSESGTAPSFGQVVLRRLTLIFSGPLQLIDWGFVFFNQKHQRGLDILAHTLVIEDPRGRAMETVPASPAA